MNRQSNRVDYWARVGFVSLLLAVMVVIRHNSSFANYEDPSGRAFQRFLIRTVTEIAVPMFFVLSGMNFFRNYEPTKTAEKLKHRVKSLLIPYLVWNTIYCIFSLITSKTQISRFFIGREKYLFSIPNLIFGCLYHWNCNVHVWFVFDLILFSLISPVFFFLVKDHRIGILAIVASYMAIFLFKLALPETIIGETYSIFYYLLGAYLALHSGLFRQQERSGEGRKTGLSGMWTGLLLVSSTFSLAILLFPPELKPLIIMSGSYGMWWVSSAVPGNNLLIQPGGTTFFLYAFHGIL